MNRFKLAAAFLLLMAACTGFPFFGKKSPSPPSRGSLKDEGATESKFPPRTRMEIQDIHYDGWTLSGRVLVSPETGPLRLDRRLTPWGDVEIKRVSECERGSVPSILLDFFSSGDRSENLLVLNPGYWYGNTVRFWLFDERLTGGLGPECVEADIILRSFDGERVARQRIRAVRSTLIDGGMQVDGGIQTDGGLQEEPQPSPDAGSP
jgi:hypothetical protein